jgi:hypothetical protein
MQPSKATPVPVICAEYVMGFLNPGNLPYNRGKWRISYYASRERNSRLICHACADEEEEEEEEEEEGVYSHVLLHVIFFLLKLILYYLMSESLWFSLVTIDVRITVLSVKKFLPKSYLLAVYTFSGSFSR